MRTSPGHEPAADRHASAVVAGLVVGCFLTWNISNVGAAADPLARAYGVSLAVVGLLTTALFVTHLLSQLPAGIWSDRIGPLRVAPRCAWRAGSVRLEVVGRDVVEELAEPLDLVLLLGRHREPGLVEHLLGADDAAAGA